MREDPPQNEEPVKSRRKPKGPVEPCQVLWALGWALRLIDFLDRHHWLP